MEIGNFSVRGGILEAYLADGGLENSCLHRPISNEYKGVYDSKDVPIGHIQLFEGGDIHWNPTKNVFIVHCTS
jgi:Uncharacterized protein potentially involved in peptidoglycan biosynthesis